MSRDAHVNAATGKAELAERENSILADARISASSKDSPNRGTYAEVEELEGLRKSIARGTSLEDLKLTHEELKQKYCSAANQLLREITAGLDKPIPTIEKFKRIMGDGVISLDDLGIKPEELSAVFEQGLIAKRLKALDRAILDGKLPEAIKLHAAIVDKMTDEAKAAYAPYIIAAQAVQVQVHRFEWRQQCAQNRSVREIVNGSDDVILKELDILRRMLRDGLTLSDIGMSPHELRMRYIQVGTRMVDSFKRGETTPSLCKSQLTALVKHGFITLADITIDGVKLTEESLERVIEHEVQKRERARQAERERKQGSISKQMDDAARKERSGRSGGNGSKMTSEQRSGTWGYSGPRY